MTRPTLTVVPDDQTTPREDARALRELAERAMARITAMTPEQRVDQLREGYRLSYQHLGDLPSGWLGLLAQAVGDTAKPLNLAAGTPDDPERVHRWLRTAEEYAEHAAACALELARAIRETRTGVDF